MWLIYAFLSLLFWGIWGFITKVALTSSEWYHYYVYGALSTFIAVISTFLYYREDMSIEFNQFILILAASGLGVLGYIFFILGVKNGEASIVVPLTSLYPLITAILSGLFLGEELPLRKVLGIFLAVLAVILLSTE